MAGSAKQEPSPYAAPALGKGLDILELLAGEEQPLTLKAMAESLGRSKGEIFRMVMVLLDRGYIDRDAETDAFSLTNRLFSLGLRTPRVKYLLSEAIPELARLADEVGQSLHLVVLYRGETVVIAALPSRSDMSFTLRLGYRRVSIDATSGQVIIAFQSASERKRLIVEARRLQRPVISDEDLKASLQRIRSAGSEMRSSRDFVGITDICVPILGSDGAAIASALLSYVDRHTKPARHVEALEKLRVACRAIGNAVQGAANHN